MRRITAEQRRAALVRRHRLDGSAEGPDQVVAALLALHATDPASIVLSVLARSAAATPDAVLRALHERRTLVRWLAMRRTLFVIARDDVPLVQSAIGTDLAARLRRQLVSRIVRGGIEPSLGAAAPDRWLAALGDRVEARLREIGPATGARLRAVEPALQAVFGATSASQSPQGLTSPLLTLMGAAGRLVRGDPTGAWTTRGTRWEPIGLRWPDGLPAIDAAAARTELARRWLERFGPATPDDLRWWSGWSGRTTDAALRAIDLERVDLDGVEGIDLPGRGPLPPAAPVAALLPALDPTPLGWRHRDWYTALDPGLLYDRAGNIGPTLWWDGEIVGAWSHGEGGIRLGIVADRGGAAVAALERAAHDLEPRLAGARITPAVRTPLEHRLAGG